MSKRIGLFTVIVILSLAQAAHADGKKKESPAADAAETIGYTFAGVGVASELASKGIQRAGTKLLNRANAPFGRNVTGLAMEGEMIQRSLLKDRAGDLIRMSSRMKKLTTPAILGGLALAAVPQTIDLANEMFSSKCPAEGLRSAAEAAAVGESGVGSCNAHAVSARTAKSAVQIVIPAILGPAGAAAGAVVGATE